MKIKEITESLSPNTDFKAINGQKSAIPGNGPVPQLIKYDFRTKYNINFNELYRIFNGRTIKGWTLVKQG